jgi:hypothetical protein
MATITTPETVADAAGARLIERFMPQADVTERHETVVHAPAGVVFDLAQKFDLQSIPIIRAIFWLRGKILGVETPPARLFAKGLVAETTATGWGILAERPGRELVAGSVTQPWKGAVVFTPVAPERFAAFAEPDMVKIVWTLENGQPVPPVRSAAVACEAARSAGTRRHGAQAHARHRAAGGIKLIPLVNFV